MREWSIEDRGGEIYILHGEKYIEKKKLYPSPDEISNVEFYLLYNEEKTVGYQLNYKYDEKFPKFITYNSFGIVYSKQKNSKPHLEVIFEDATVRFLAYEHAFQIRDYFLVGRWRNASNPIDPDNIE